MYRIPLLGVYMDGISLYYGQPMQWYLQWKENEMTGITSFRGQPNYLACSSHEAEDCLALE